MSQGPSLLETLTNAVTTSEHRECVQGKEVAYGRKEGIGWAMYDEGKVRENCVETTTFFDFSHKALPVLNAYKYNATSKIK